MEGDITRGDLKCSFARIDGHSKFLTKFWNISKFISLFPVVEAQPESTDEWILAELSNLLKTVEIKYELTPKTAIPIFDLKDKLSIFQNLSSPHAWSGFFRGSPKLFQPNDGSVIIEAIKEAMANPVEREYDEAKYWRRPRKTLY
jgi:hypothetical protein